MKDDISKYTVTSNTTKLIDFEFEGTAIDFAHIYADEMYGIRDIGYASDILSKYETLLTNNNFSEEHTQVIKSKIETFAKFDKNEVIYTNINHREPLISSDFSKINPDFTVKIEPKKNQLVLQIEALGYSIQATSQSDGLSRLYLVEGTSRVSKVDFQSNREYISIVRDKLAGKTEFRDNTYLAYGLEKLYANALAHSMANDRVAPEKIKALVERIPSYAQADYKKSLEALTGKVKEEVKVAEPEKEMFYLIHAVSVQNLNGKPVHFTNDFVGTERDFNEYKANYGKKPTMKANIVRVETFAPEFRATHREIEKIVFAYQNNTGDKSKMLNTLKTFDEEAIVRLETRLKEEGINPKKFESDMKAEPHNKIKPKM